MKEKCYFCGKEFDMDGQKLYERYARYYRGVPVCGCCCEDHSMEMDLGISSETIRKALKNESISRLDISKIEKGAEK